MCKRPACYHSATKTHVADMIFKLSPIHASLIISFLEFAEITESSAPFRKNSNHQSIWQNLFGKFISTVVRVSPILKRWLFLTLHWNINTLHSLCGYVHVHNYRVLIKSDIHVNNWGKFTVGRKVFLVDFCQSVAYNTSVSTQIKR